MSNDLMILPADVHEDIRLIRIPDDFEAHEAYRYVTGIIAKAEEEKGYDWDDISELLEDRGFEVVEFVIGPSLDYNS